MDIRNKTILILGGSGLVGLAVARRLLTHGPRKVVLVALREDEVRRGVEELAPLAGATEIASEWGNVFVPAAAARVELRDAIADPRLRSLILGDLLPELDAGILGRSFLHEVIDRHRPDAVIDCINTATAFAYQNVFDSARRLHRLAVEGRVTLDAVEEHLLTLPLPQLIRHIQILLESLRAVGTAAYVKIGTSGTGGMGLNIPYTHSEEKPSRTLLAKSAVAGAQTLLLFLVARTPGGPATAEIKPTATIGWKEIEYGPIRRGGREFRRFDCNAPVPAAEAFETGRTCWSDSGSPLLGVYANMGENGVFAREEFETVTGLGSMELITPEEVADYVVQEISGRPSGRDIIAALDGASAGPTYRAAMLRSAAIERLRALEEERGVRSIAFEMLGPPRLTKHLFEAYILSGLAERISDLALAEPAELARRAADLIQRDGNLRSTIISVGIPIVVEGPGIYRSPVVMVPPDERGFEAAVPRGWVDLRAANMSVWVARAARIVQQTRERAGAPAGSGSGSDWYALDASEPVKPSRLALWIFRYEDDGERIKR